jgi:hypothetical protein
MSTDARYDVAVTIAWRGFRGPKPVCEMLRLGQAVASSAALSDKSHRPGEVAALASAWHDRRERGERMTRQQIPTGGRRTRGART